MKHTDGTQNILVSFLSVKFHETLWKTTTIRTNSTRPALYPASSPHTSVSFSWLSFCSPEVLSPTTPSPSREQSGNPYSSPATTASPHSIAGESRILKCSGGEVLKLKMTRKQLLVKNARTRRSQGLYATEKDISSEAAVLWVLS